MGIFDLDVERQQAELVVRGHGNRQRYSTSEWHRNWSLMLCVLDSSTVLVGFFSVRLCHGHYCFTSVIILCSFTLPCYECTRYRQCILAVTFVLFCFVATLCVNKDVYIKHHVITVTVLCDRRSASVNQCHTWQRCPRV